MRITSGKILLGTVVGAIYVYMTIPMAVVVLFSFSDKSYFVFPPHGLSLRWYAAALATNEFVQPALLSLLIAVLATLVAAAFSIPAALALRKLRARPWAAAIEFLLLSPLVIPHLIVGIALLYFYARIHAVDTFGGLLAAHTLIVFPFMFRSVLTSAIELKPQHEEASDILGATPYQTYTRIIFPALRPGLSAGAIFAFITSFDQFTLNLFITQSERVTLPVALYKYMYDVNDPVTAAVSTALIAIGLLIAFAAQRAGWLNHLGSGSA